MINDDKDIIQDEEGWYFVYGPLWFVILVMIITIIASPLKNNNSDAAVHNQFPDYENIQTSKIFCPQCGAKNPYYSNFCQKCNYSFYNLKKKYLTRV